ncbi:hypothetical protein EV424DRAFT_1075288 [Suillus variegatus]|nr:hypothetical protein EV424DRAFT_1075288 [Suillus variegatus]
MEYSAVDISAATSLQRLAYLYMSMTTFWTCDYACALHEEWEFLRWSRWTKVKALYIMTRHLPFFLIVMHLYLNFAPIEDPDKCRMLINVYSCFFMIRTYALWNNNRIVLVGLLSTAFLRLARIPGTPSCPSRSSSVLYFISFIFLFVFQLVLIILTLTRAIQSWWSTKGPLQAILVKHNIFYYVCGLCESGFCMFHGSVLIGDDYCSESSLGRQCPCASAISQLPILHRPRTLSGVHPCDPCHAHAPPSLASRPTYA